MITVAHHKAFHQIKMLLIDPHQTVFVENKHSETVTSIQHFRCGRIVRSTNAVVAHLFKFFYSEFLQSIGNGSTYPGMILMHVGANNLYTFTIQKKSLIWVEKHGANADIGCITIHNLALSNNVGFQFI